MPREERHIITAMGLSNTLGDSVGIVWKRALEGVPIFREPPFELPFQTVCGLVDGPLDAPPAAYAAYDTRLARITLRAVTQVTAAVARLRSRVGRDRIGVVVGTSTGGLDTTELAYRQFRGTGARLSGFSLRRSHAFDAIAVLVAEVLELSGPTYAVSTACTSSAKAIASAQRLMRGGICDAVVVVGADAICETTVRGFHALGVLSTGPARPFSRDRAGIHIGEGAAVLVLERNGDGPARVSSVGETSDAHSMSAPHPEGTGAARAMARSLEAACVEASSVGYVNAHGTGTEQNDAAESRAILATLPKDVPVSSTKGLTGHMLGACGATEVAFTALAVMHGELPGSAGASPLDPALGIRVLDRPLRTAVHVALSNSFAFGGSNATVVITCP